MFILKVKTGTDGGSYVGYRLVHAVCPVRLRTTGHRHRLWKQQHFKLLIGQPGRLGAGQIVAYGLGGQLRITRREALAIPSP
ncbi:MAG: hypothetical protein OXM02_04955 [Bacteroidota bacterium]|nr:hypothetical protein [Bacteroidota bacterium]MDE2833851.1 hypothetical protein [Bacteroidota bacterium]MDE2957981.1 hypothetical protein [Bacteroidota bacterium]